MKSLEWLFALTLAALMSLFAECPALATGETYTPNMSLVCPGVGVTSGPQWANDIISTFFLIDAHDHTPGKGAPITPSAININSDLAAGDNNITNPRSVRFSSQGSLLSGASDLGAIYESGVDLYYRDGNGNNVRITQSGAISGTPGTISGLVAPASASYVPASATFFWQSAANTPANLDAGSLTLREVTTSPNGITLNSPAGLAANYSLTFPGALPSAQKFMTLDASGNIAAPWAADNSSLEVSSNSLRVKALGIGSAQIAAGAVTQAKRASLGQVVSSSSGISLGQTGTNPVPNLSISITTTGRPVFLIIQPDGSANGYGFGTGNNGTFFIQRDGTTVAVFTAGQGGAANGAYPMSYVDTGASAATHTYTVYMSTSAYSFMNYAVIMAYEL